MDMTAEQLQKNMEELSSMFCSKMAEFEKNLQQSNTKESTSTVKTLAAEYFSFKTFMWKALGILKSQMELLVLSVDRLDTYSRRKVLLLHGLKEEKNEDLIKRTLSVLTSQMKLTGLSSGTVESCHRLGMSKEGTRPILVRFCELQHRRLVWNAKTELKGSKITVTEFLTKPRQEIFSAARNHFGVRKCWTADGTINVLLPDKTRKKLFSLVELRKLIEQFPSKSTEMPGAKVK